MRLRLTNTKGELRSFSLVGGEPRARAWLRQVLRYQLASEAIRRARRSLLLALAVSSGVLWIAAARPELLDETVVRTALVVWIVVLGAAVVTLGLEWRWLRLQQSLLRKESK